MNFESLATGAVFYDARDGHPAAERRVRDRAPLRWPLSILQGQRGAHVLSTVTENLSSGGFCCILDEPLAAGAWVVCILELPALRDLRKFQSWRCQAQVVWVRVMEDGPFCIGCRIDDYTVVA